MNIFTRKTFKVRRATIYRVLELTGWGSAQNITPEGWDKLMEAVQVLRSEIEQQRR